MRVSTAHPEVVQKVIGLHQAHPVGWFHRFFIQQRLHHFSHLLTCVTFWLWTEKTPKQTGTEIMSLSSQQCKIVQRNAVIFTKEQFLK